MLRGASLGVSRLAGEAEPGLACGRPTRERTHSRSAVVSAGKGLGTMASPAIDQVQLSRQLYVMGMEAQTRMAQSDVLVVGMGGVGVEIGESPASAPTRRPWRQRGSVCDSASFILGPPDTW